jgi:hypothetical protein
MGVVETYLPQKAASFLMSTQIPEHVVLPPLQSCFSRWRETEKGRTPDCASWMSGASAQHHQAIRTGRA